jgi:tRNA pseudouridine38-40 synthase
VAIRLKAEIEYDGTDFYGWQKQKDRRTVQGEIEKVLAQRFDRRIVIVAAGRTDTGVHATGQVIHFDCPLNTDDASVLPDMVAEVRKSLTEMLPRDIACTVLEIAPPGFHARFSAKARRYRYDIYLGRTALECRYCWEIRYQLVVGRMRRSLPPLLGRHIFEPLAKLNPGEKHYRCTVFDVSLKKCGNVLSFTITADRFLHGMVRAIVGTLVDVGRGAKDTDIFTRIVETQDRTLVGCLAPARGLVLEAVEY